MGSCEICGAEKVGTRAVLMGRAEVSACTRCIENMNLEPLATKAPTTTRKKSVNAGGYGGAGRAGRDMMVRGEKELVSNFAKLVTSAREKKGLDKRELAHRLSEKINIIQSVESGKRPTDSVITKLEKFLDIELLVAIQPEETTKVGTAPGRGMTLGDFLNHQN
jgi:putative transcription factor